MESAIETRRFDAPDQLMDMKDAGGIAVVQMRGGAIGARAVFEPGRTWEKDEKPLLGHPPSCPTHHTGYSLSGELVVRMVDTGVETRITPGDFFDIPPGRDAYVAGDERVELILFAPPAHAH
jgi:hypothetical protein